MHVASCSKQLKVQIHTYHHPTIKLSRSPPVRIGQGVTGTSHSFFCKWHICLGPGILDTKMLAYLRPSLLRKGSKLKS